MNPDIIAAIIFFMTYVGIALGSIRGLAIDRTGIAVLGAIAMLTTGTLSEHEALKAIDAPTIFLLYSLMVLSAQFTLGGFYTRVAMSIVRFVTRPEVFLFALIFSSALLSAVVANDIVCLAFTPVICVATVRSSLNPIPFALALLCEQHWLCGNHHGQPSKYVDRSGWGTSIWQICVMVSDAINNFAYCPLFHNPGNVSRKMAGRIVQVEFSGARLAQIRFLSIGRNIIRDGADTVVLYPNTERNLCADRSGHTPLQQKNDDPLNSQPSGLGVLSPCFALSSLLLKCVTEYGIPQSGVLLLGTLGYNINDPLVISSVTLVLSNVVSNVPAVMLLLKNIDVGQTTNLYLLALVSSYAGNLFIIGSIANLITIEQAKIYNISVSFWSHARIGIPVTAASVFVALVWDFMIG